MGAEHGPGADDAKAICPAEPARDAGGHAAGPGARPVALQYLLELQRDWACTSLDHPLNRALMCLVRYIDAGIGNEIDLKPPIEGRQRRAYDTDAVHRPASTIRVLPILLISPMTATSSQVLI